MAFYNAFVPEIIHQEEVLLTVANGLKLTQKIILGNCISVCIIIAACSYLLCQCC